MQKRNEKKTEFDKNITMKTMKKNFNYLKLDNLRALLEHSCHLFDRFRKAKTINKPETTQNISLNLDSRQQMSKAISQ